MKRFTFISLLISCLFSVFSAFPQQAGTLDTGFGNNGIVLEAYGSGSAAELTHSILLPDGKILASGKVYLPTYEIAGCLARFLPNGELDSSFGSNGWQIYNLDYDIFYFTSLAQQANGKYIAVGHAENFSSDGFFICRMNADGSLDSSFGTGGHTLVNTGNSTEAQSVVIQPDGRIVLAGYRTYQGGDGDAIVCRLNTDGTMDNTFSGDGISTVDLHGNSYDIVRGLAIHEGNILISGMALNGNGSDYDALVLAQFKPDGTLDPMFGVGGISIIDDVNQEDMLISPSTNLVVAPDNKIFVTTHITGIEGNDVALFKFLPNGYPDNSFGEYGMTLYDMTDDNYSNSLALQSDGKIVVAGTHYLDSGSEFLVMRFLANGDIDDSFGEFYGVALFNLSNSGFDVATTVHIQNDAKILVSGYSNSDDLFFAHIRLFSGLETFIETQNISRENDRLYPNPVCRDEFRINYRLTESTKLNISLLNGSGQFIANLLEAKRDEGNHNELLRLPEKLPAGTYLISGIAGNKRLFVKKFVKGKP